MDSVALIAYISSVWPWGAQRQLMFNLGSHPRDIRTGVASVEKIKAQDFLTSILTLCAPTTDLQPPGAFGLCCGERPASFLGSESWDSSAGLSIPQHWTLT
jgi:hypothetical protein